MRKRRTWPQMPRCLPATARAATAGLVTAGLATAGLVTGALATPASSSASPLPGAAPIVLSAWAEPATVPASGGTVTLAGAVEHASSCRLRLLSGQSFPVVYPGGPTSGCRGGTYSARVTIGANPTAQARVVTFAVAASDGTTTSSQRVSVVLAGAPVAAVVSASARPAALSASGGTVEVTATLRDSTSCRLELLSSQPFRVVYSSQPRPCQTGFVEPVSFGPNALPVHRTVAFGLVARNAVSSFTGRFYVTLAAPRSSAVAGLAPTTPASSTTTPGGVPSTTTSPVTTGQTTTTRPGGAAPTPTPTSTSAPTTAPGRTTTTTPTTAPTTTTVPARAIANVMDTNWSGYAVTGGPYDQAGGTFTVPRLSAGTPATEVMSEWVGTDGIPATSGATDLLQAGVMESMEECQGASTNPATVYNPDVFYICPWTFVIENGRDIEGPLPQLTVSAGDSVSVGIKQVSGPEWSISMRDVTNGQTWSTDIPGYTGPGSSAEWVVEDAGVVGQGCGVIVNGSAGQCSLAPYDPPVTFSNLDLGPTAAGTWYDVGLLQNGAEVSTPSALTTNGSGPTGFTVSYTGPETPGPAATQAPT